MYIPEKVIDQALATFARTGKARQKILDTMRPVLVHEDIIFHCDACDYTKVIAQVCSYRLCSLCHKYKHYYLLQNVRPSLTSVRPSHVAYLTLPGPYMPLFADARNSDAFSSDHLVAVFNAFAVIRKPTTVSRTIQHLSPLPGVVGGFQFLTVEVHQNLQSARAVLHVIVEMQSSLQKEPLYTSELATCWQSLLSDPALAIEVSVPSNLRSERLFQHLSRITSQLSKGEATLEALKRLAHVRQRN